MKRTNAKRTLIIFIIVTLLISFSAILYASGAIINNPTTITFSDRNLYESIKKQFSSKKITYNGNDVEQSIEVSLDEVNKITELNLQGANNSRISNLTGLENFTNLKVLNLSSNSITDATSLNSLVKLEKLNIAENQINTSILTSISNITSLTDLDMTNTQINGDQLTNLINLRNLQTLILANNNISTVESLAGLSGITKLDISVNKSFTDFTQLTSFTSLVELNVSGTGITTFSGEAEATGIELLTNLEKLYASNNSSITTVAGISSIYATYKEGTENVPYLKQLKVLNLNSMGTAGKRPSVAFNNFAKIPTLQELHLASNEINNLSGIAKLENLEYLDLADNKIESSALKNLIQTKTEQGEKVVQTENTLCATKIDLRQNEIIDISIFYDYPANIQWLDLSGNHIYDVNPLGRHSCSEGLYLQNQDITFGLYKKIAKVNHYIILPNILRYSKTQGNFMYAEDAELHCSGVTLNEEYTNPNEYNVIIDYAKTKDDILTISLSGGKADGTTLTFKIGTKGNVDCLIESLYINDNNLYTKIENELEKQKITYIEKVPKIININRDAVDKITNLDLQHTSSSESTKIKDLTGLENFYSLVTLYLQNNDVKTINQLETCTKLQTLYLSNNSNIGDNNSIIEKMSALVTLNLSNTGMTNIDSINKLTETFTSKKKATKIVDLNISDNQLNNIDGIEKITTLQSLSIANTNVDDTKIEKITLLTNLTTLNINGNKIEELEVLSDLSQLKYLYFNNNKVQSLEPIRGKVFYELEFTGNMIKDITPLSSHRTINNLKMDNNKIEDTTVLSRISISEQQILSITGQKITKLLDDNLEGEVSIDLPQIFKASQAPNNKLYTSSELIMTKCKLDSTGDKIIINVDELNNDIAQVEISGGKAHGTILYIASPIKGTITYTPSNITKTKQNVTATISFNRSETTITNNNGSNTYIFEENGEFEFEFADKYGFEGKSKAIVQNIDRLPPVGKISQERKDEKVEVTILVNEKVENIDGWTLTELQNGKVKLTKQYSVDTNEDIQLIDEAGNTTTINVQVKVSLSDIVTSETLKISEENLIIRGINPKTSVSEIISNLNAEMEYEILDKNNTKVSNSAKVGTGYKIKMQNEKVYTIIVWGDLTGNGQISLSELAKIAKIGAGKITPTDIEKSAIDMNMNDKIEISELAAIAKLSVK